jgi:hypothetical protein
MLADQISAELRSRNGTVENNSEDVQKYEAHKSETGHQFEEELARFDAKWDERESQFVRRQQDEMEKFEERWSQSIPKKYRKQSTRLLTLLDVEKKLGFMAQFDEATVVRDEANALEQREMEMAQSALISDYEAAKKQFEAEQRADRKLFEAKRAGRRDEIVVRQKVQMEYVTNREHVLDGKSQPRAKKNESSFDIMARDRPRTGKSVRMHHDQTARPKATPLLPVLLAPNDPKVQEMKKNQQRKQKQKNHKFLVGRAQKWRQLEDLSEQPVQPQQKKPKPPPQVQAPLDPVVPDAFKDLVESIAIPEDCPDDVQACEPATFDLTQSPEYRQ